MKNEKLNGLYGSSEYIVWANIKQRCYSEKHPQYKRYGERGIIIYEEWKNSFLNFYNDMGPKPFPEAQIDREDNDGNYEPGNCRWATRKLNTINRSTTKLTMDIAEDIREMYKTKKYYFGYISEKYGVSRQMINNIVNNKSWVPEERSDQFPNTNNKKIKIYKDCNKSKDIIEDNHIRSIFEKQITKNIKYKYKDFKAGYISASFKKKQIIKSIDSIIKNFREKDPAEHYNMLRALEEILKVLMQQ